MNVKPKLKKTTTHSENIFHPRKLLKTVPFKLLCSTLLLLAFFTQTANAFPFMKTQEKKPIKILDVVWASAIDDNGDAVKLKSENAPPNKPLYLWMKLQTSKKVFDKFKHEDDPIYHVWYRFSGDITFLENTRPLTQKTKPPEKNRNLKEEVQENGEIAWKAWTYIENPFEGLIRVTFSDRSSFLPILCTKKVLLNAKGKSAMSTKSTSNEGTANAPNSTPGDNINSGDAANTPNSNQTGDTNSNFLSEVAPQYRPCAFEIKITKRSNNINDLTIGKKNGRR